MASPANLNRQPEESQLVEIINCDAKEKPGKKDYTPWEILQILHKAYVCTRPKQDYPHYLSEGLIGEIIKAESEYNPYAISPKGARGLMQIKSVAWREVEKERPYHRYVFDPQTNIEVGIKYLLSLDKYLEENHSYWEKLSTRQKRVMVLATYNFGPENLKQRGFQFARVPPETRNYAWDVITGLENFEYMRD